MPVLECPFYGPFSTGHAEKRLPLHDVTRKRGNAVSACTTGGTSLCKGDKVGGLVKDARERINSSEPVSGPGRINSPLQSDWLHRREMAAAARHMLERFVGWDLSHQRCRANKFAPTVWLAASSWNGRSGAAYAERFIGRDLSHRRCRANKFSPTVWLGEASAKWP